MRTSRARSQSERRRGRTLRWALVLVVLAGSSLAGTSLAVAPGGGTAAAADPAPVPGTGAAHPRVLYAAGQEPLLRDRLTREPYRTVFVGAHQRAASYNSAPLGDMAIVTQRNLSRAAKVFAFEYALDRTVIDGAIVPFPDAAARQAAGDRVRALLLNLYPRDRMAVPAPLGGFDRDINTSEEIVNYATAFDTMLGTSYDFGADRAAVVDLLTAVTGELHLNFVQPETASGFANLNQNNHRSKSGASMAVAAVVLADDVPAAADWFADGVLLVDDVLRFMLVTGDGAYSEGPYYYRYTMQNLAPLISIWDRFLGAAPWTARGIDVPSPSRTALFGRTQRWMMDTTLPDGTMAPIDDGNPGRSYYFGVLPSDLPDTAAGYWRWADTPQSFEVDGSVELGPDTIVAYDESVEPAPPSWSPTQFYVEGGTATLRSAWSPDALVSVVLGEHDTASSFGRDRTGAGRWPQSHEHPDGGSFMLHAFGERLAIDPGYLTFTTHSKVNKAQDHNMVLVDGAGPSDYLNASLDWRFDVFGRPPAEGQATLYDTLDSPGLAATSVATDYRDTTIARRFLQADDRYLVIADAVDGSGSSLSWMLHGNGGGTSGGSFAPTELGGRWEIGGARLDAGVAVVGEVPALAGASSIHEVPYGQERTHTALRATVPTGSADSLQVLYPTSVDAAPPQVARLDGDGATTLVLTDAAEDRRVHATRVGGTVAGVQVIDEHLDGRLRLAFGDGVSSLAHDGASVVATTPGTLGLRLEAGGTTATVVADTGDDQVDVAGLGFSAATVDGACRVDRDGDRTRVTLHRERRITLRADAGNARPAADAGGFRRVDPGSSVTLDGTASCDSDGDELTPSWELVSAPAGSSWSLEGAGTFHPNLTADVAGPYRVRLVVTDAAGARSLEQEVLVIAGPRCADGVDNDVDGLIDTDDADCDGVDPPPPTTTTTSSTSTTSTTLADDAATTTTTTDVGASTSTPAGPGPSRPPSAPPAVVAVAVVADPRFSG